MMFILLLAGVGDLLINIWLATNNFTTEFKSNVYQIAILLSFAAYLNAITGPFRSWFIAAKNELLVLQINIFVMSLAICAFFAIIETVHGMALVSIAAYLLRFCLYLFFTNQRLK